MSASNPLRCRIGWHRWKRVTFRALPGVEGRYCPGCTAMQMWWPRFLRPSWRTLDAIDIQLFKPNEDAHGYY